MANRRASQSISSLYCLKALGAFLVVCIHSFSPWFLFPIVRTAVPFFLIISGYFLYSQDENQALQRCISAFKKIFWITLYANLFYYLCFRIPDDLFPFKKVTQFVLYIVTGERMSSHLWYLNAYLEALLIIIVALKFKKLKLVWYSIPVGILIGLLAGRYNFFFDSESLSVLLSRNFFTVGIPCVGIGWLLHKYYPLLSKKLSTPATLALILFALSIAEMLILHFTTSISSGDYLITTIPLSALTVYLCLKYPSLWKNTVIETIGKKYSTNIYIFHIFILTIYRIFKHHTWDIPTFLSPFIVFFLTILFIKLWGKCSNIVFKT